MKRLLFFAGALSLFCVDTQRCASSPGALGARQGIRGYVRRVEGNQMPSPDRPRSKPKGFPATICVFPMVTSAEVVPGTRTSFYRAVRAPLIRSIRADSSGYFRISLDTGGYSLFLRIGNAYYAGLLDQFNHLCPVRVEPHRETYVELLYRGSALY